MMEFSAFLAVVFSKFWESITKETVSFPAFKAALFLMLMGMTGFVLGASVLSIPGFVLIGSEPIIFIGELGVEMAPILISAGIILLALDYWIDKKISNLEAKNLLFDIQSENNLVAIKALSKARRSGFTSSGLLRQINLKGANLEGGDLSGMDFFRANLDAANLENCSLAYSSFNEATARQTNFQSANLNGGNLERADLRQANLELANLANANFNSCNLAGANLASVYANGANFGTADLSLTNFENANLADTNFRNADLHEANLKNADLRGANLKNAGLQGANLEGANLKDIIFSANTTWPSGFDLSSNNQKITEETGN